MFYKINVTKITLLTKSILSGAISFSISVHFHVSALWSSSLPSISFSFCYIFLSVYSTVTDPASVCGSGSRCSIYLDSDLTVYSSLAQFPVRCKKKPREILTWATVARTKPRGGRKILLPRPLVLRHRCQHRNLAHSDIAFFYRVTGVALGAFLYCLRSYCMVF
jgi:hypothetical protein